MPVRASEGRREKAAPKMPSMMGKEKKQKQLIEDLPNQFRSCMKKYNLASGGETTTNTVVIYYLFHN